MTTEGYISVPGGKVWYERIGENQNIPLLVLHGGPGFPHNYLKTLDRLKTTRPIIYYDQLGCGKSDWPKDKKLWRIERFVEELKIVTEKLKLKKFHLFGHSWGTMLAVDYLLAYPEGIVSLILASPVINIQVWAKNWEEYRKDLPVNVQAVLKHHELEGTIDSKEYKQAVKISYQYFVCRLYPEPKESIESGKATNKEVYNTMWGPNEFTCTGNLKSYNRTKDLKKIKVPTLFTCGRFDGATPKTTKHYQSLISGSELAVFETSAHMPHLEEPNKYLTTINSFLNKADEYSIM